MRRRLDCQAHSALPFAAELTCWEIVELSDRGAAQYSFSNVTFADLKDGRKSIGMTIESHMPKDGCTFTIPTRRHPKKNGEAFHFLSSFSMRHWLILPPSAPAAGLVSSGKYPAAPTSFNAGQILSLSGASRNSRRGPTTSRARYRSFSIAIKRVLQSRKNACKHHE
jgi:hypothetical protein